MNKSMRVAFCGVITALAIVFMLLTGLIPIGTYALPALAGVLSVIIVIEMGARWAFPVYIAVSVISLLLAADKEAVVLFIAFFGYYPMLKAKMESLHKRLIEYLLKFAVFNAAMIVSFFITIYILRVPQESFTVFGIYLPWVFLVVGNVVFIIYDYAVSGLAVAYCQRLRKSLSHLLHLK